MSLLGNRIPWKTSHQSTSSGIIFPVYETVGCNRPDIGIDYLVWLQRHMNISVNRPRGSINFLSFFHHANYSSWSDDWVENFYPLHLVHLHVNRFTSLPGILYLFPIWVKKLTLSTTRNVAIFGWLRSLCWCCHIVWLAGCRVLRSWAIARSQRARLPSTALGDARNQKIMW